MHKIFTDQMNRMIRLDKKPERIISLVPSQTELLADLGLEDQLVGITRFCIHPESVFKSKTKTGGTKKINFETIRKLKPDLIIGNKEENEKDQVEQLMTEFNVWMSDIKTLEDAFDMMKMLGEITGTEKKAGEIIEVIRNNFSALQPVKNKRRVIYFIWKDPWMAAGSDTFINEMLNRSGLLNIVDEERYPVLTEERIRELSPECILLSSEPYPFSEKHIMEIQKILPETKIILADGELFSWYGSRLLHSAEYFRELAIEHF